MKWTVKELLTQLLATCFFIDPTENEIMVQMYERDENGCVIDIHTYPITGVRGADGYNRICIEKNQEIIL